jgi:tetratricopeptide (TPR) repeat protein
MASTTRIDELKKKFDENPRRYFAPLANEFRKSGEIDQAIMICEEFLPQQPGHMSGHIVYGQALYEAGRLPEARSVFETALGLDPENLIALRHLGDIARTQHDTASARSWYVRVLDADPRNDEIQSLIAGLDAADVGDPVVDFMPAAAATPPGLGLDVEKDSMPFDQMPTREVVARPFDRPPTPDVTETPFDQLPTREVAARPFIDLSLADTAPAGVPIITAAPTSTRPNEPEVLDGLTLHGFGNASRNEGETSDAAPAEGFESAEFAPPSEHVPAAELDASLDSGVPSFSSPEHRIEALDGLEGSGGQPHDRHQESDGSGAGLEPLDLEGGLLPPAETEAPPAMGAAPPFNEPSPPAGLLDFDLSAPIASDEHDHRGEGGQREHDEREGSGSAYDSVPTELPPEVIAAEAALIMAGETPPPSAPEYRTEAAARPPFVTETMAELYLAQGFRDQALAVYSDLLAANPGDARLSGIVASLAPARGYANAGPNVREFFARIASRQPGAMAASYQPPSDDDFATASGPPDDSDVASEPEALEPHAFVPEAFDAEPTPVAASALAEVAPAIERAAATQQAEGSIDALFGNRSTGTSEDSAAAALAQAFGGASDLAGPPPIPGRPAHAAKGELSLDSVFRDGPARPARSSQGFSFDQFFAGAEDRAARSSPPRGVGIPAESREAPAERGADDIEQFNSWLQGLKQR